MNGWIEEVKDDRVRAIIQKTSDGIKYELEFDIAHLTEEQLKLLSLGQVIQWDEGDVTFLTEDETWI
jgi:hypothetical protein